ncbi:ribulose-phosphate 3-epimerase [Metamycoplasma canadense]|uniref:Ribulose-phosphate 3-epimerase n=1 Tax=Metamycoplasma canadense TaxID=29554 RepID=A0A077L673_9BACT|nr:ribulose-phosphate 3-epimerase [Metamycoplasma canadense]BAP39462.1 ribulose-phosphate 3-epimerase [Metamycoplasma canadense]
MKKISPSILDVNKDYFVNYVNQLIEWGVSNVHYDVMDGEFVPNVALQYDDIKKIYKNCKKHEMDIHLMVKDTIYYYELFKDFNANLTFHFEAFNNNLGDLNSLIKRAKKEKVKLGLAVNPDTNVEEIFPYLKDLNLVLVMSVYPGKGGQTFLEESYKRVKQLKEYINDNDLKTIIQIDGGVKDFNIKKCFEFGVDLAVVGSYLVNNFSHDTIKKLLI